MAKVVGKVLIDTDRGVEMIEVPERGAVGLLRTAGFEPRAGGPAGNVVGTLYGVAVILRAHKPRA